MPKKINEYYKSRLDDAVLDGFVFFSCLFGIIVVCVLAMIFNR